MTCPRAAFDSLIHLTRRIRAVARLLTIVSASIAFAASGSTIVQAATATANMAVQLTVTASCTINAATLDFGNATLLATLIDATTTLSVTCTNTTPYSIGLDNGANFSSTRRMRQGATANYIGYAIYTDSARTNAWTTASSSTACTSANSCFLGTGNGSAQSISVYGRVPALGTAPTPGSYTDTVTMTVTY
ncbi:MAG TPA: spore coat U domain-containing protein [Bradyrhizobium sp.]|jgi:spore coat protein U-like protein|nr:spore coat U domain-containing protein [Bradyrhizobium sp.]